MMTRAQIQKQCFPAMHTTAYSIMAIVLLITGIKVKNRVGLLKEGLICQSIYLSI